MKQSKNTVALYVDKDLVNIYKASLDLYEALNAIDTLIRMNIEVGEFVNKVRTLTHQALAKADGK